MAGGGKGGVVEPGFLDTATFTLAIVLLLFLLASFAFERVSRRAPAGPGATAAAHPHAQCVAERGQPHTPCAAASPCLQSTHWLVHFLRKRKRNGLATAVTNLVTELTVGGQLGSEDYCRCRDAAARRRHELLSAAV